MGERDDYDNPDSDYEVPPIKFHKETDPNVKIANYNTSILAYMGLPLPNNLDITTGRYIDGVSKIFSNAYALI
jgi:hypothetical protein